MRTLILMLLPILASGQMYLDSYKFAAPQELLLDAYPSAAAAYSLRLLDKDYTGDCITVRRKSDGALDTFGFVNNYLDTTSLKSFCGTGATDTCWVRIWFDQSGNAENAVQTTNANQPRILVSGQINRENGIPAMQFIGSPVALDAYNLSAKFSGTDKYLSAIFVYKGTQASPANNGTVYGFGRTTSNNPLRWAGQLASGASGALQERDDASVITTTSGGTVTNRSIGWVVSNMDSKEFYINNTLINTATASTGATTLNNFVIGALQRISREGYFIGNIQELVIYDADKAADRTGMNNNVNSFYSIY